VPKVRITVSIDEKLRAMIDRHAQRLRMTGNHIEPARYLGEELIAESRTLIVVPRGRFVELCLGFRVKLNLHRRRSRRRRAMRWRVASQSTGWTDPSASSRARRPISLIHAASTSVSAGSSRLRRRSWASFARSFVGRVRAASRSGSVLMATIVRSPGGASNVAWRNDRPPASISREVPAAYHDSPGPVRRAMIVVSATAWTRITRSMPFEWRLRTARAYPYKPARIPPRRPGG